MSIKSIKSKFESFMNELYAQLLQLRNLMAFFLSTILLPNVVVGRLEGNMLKT